jgi:hypothetical protein
MNGDTSSQMSDSLAVFMEDLDEYEYDDDDDDDDEFSTQQSQIITPTIPVQPSSVPSPHIRKKPMV